MASKEALLDALVDDVLSAVATPPDTDEPLSAVRRIMLDAYDALTAHRELLPLYLARQGARGPEANRLGDAVLERLARTGLPPEARTQALQVLVVHTIGFAAFAGGVPADRTAPDDPAAIRDRFEVGLDWLLEGAARRS